MVEPDGPQTTIKHSTEMKRFACQIPKARIRTHSEYLIVTAFPWQQWLCECVPTLHYAYDACLVLFCHEVTTTQLVETNNTINCSGTHQIM